MSPKLGEIVALRMDLIDQIDSKTSVDEALMEHIITQKGYRLAYAPEALVYNCGPREIRDFINQRRRINFGHLILKMQKNYFVSTMSYARILKAFYRSGIMRHPLDLLCLLSMEGVAKSLAHKDLLIRKNHKKWKMITSTKVFK